MSSDDDPADDFTLAVQVRNAATHLWTNADLGHVGQHDRRAAGVDAERDPLQVFYAFEITGGADHVLGLAHLDHRAAGFLVAGANRCLDSGERQAECAQLVRIDDDLVLAHHAANRCDLGNPGHGLEFVLQEPVLQAA